MIKNENRFHSIIAAGASAVAFSMYIDAKLTDDVFKHSNIYISTVWVLVAYKIHDVSWKWQGLKIAQAKEEKKNRSAQTGERMEEYETFAK